MATSEGVLVTGDDAERPERPRRERHWRRRLLVLLAVLVVLAVAFLGGGGWYYSGEIGSEALTADHRAGTPHYDLVVDAVDGTAVVLRRTGDAPADDPLDSGDTYGLVWPGGAGVLTGLPVREVGGAVHRTMTTTTGSRPARGTPARLEIDVWADPRAAYGVDYQDVTFPCAGGQCPAWYVPGRSSTWWIAVHGKGAARTEPLRAMRVAIEDQLSVLDIGYRNDPDAPADPSGRYGYGATEWHDLDAAVSFAVAHGARDVVLFGSSMGGAVVASFLEHSAQAHLVTGVVLDAPALDLRSIVDWGAGQRSLPVIGTGIPDVLTTTAEWMAARRYDLDWNAVDYLPGDWVRMPVLLFHGTADDTVPIATSDQLYEAHPNLVREVRVPGAGHVQSWNVDPTGYHDALNDFLSCIVSSNPSLACLESP
jgi:pimeloyl-ACP methyl ester carboxylesterase